MRKGHNYLLLCSFRIPFVCDHSLAVLTGNDFFHIMLMQHICNEDKKLYSHYSPVPRKILGRKKHVRKNTCSVKSFNGNPKHNYSCRSHSYVW